MKISKYHGLGNDFIITEFEENRNYSEIAKDLCRFHVSVGADGFIVVKKNPLEMVFYNQDGSEAPMCGNGIRAFAMYAYINRLVEKTSFDVVTKAGIMKVLITSTDINDFRVKINMGKPIFDNEAIKASDNSNYFGKDIVINNVSYKIYSLFMGTIHTVLFVDNLEEIIKTNVGEAICNHPLFKEKTNVNFVQKIDDTNYLIRTYERGVGFTLACGTGACASFVVLNKLGLKEKEVKMHLTYGNLIISKEDSIYMEGSACHVFDTTMEVK